MRLPFLLGFAISAACIAHQDPSSPEENLVDQNAGERHVIDVQEQALALVDAWANARTDSDAAQLAGLYAEDFVGHDVEDSDYDAAGWRLLNTVRDRNLTELQLDGVFVETWLEPDSLLHKGFVTVEFEQRFQRGLYPEHEIVHLQLRLDEKLQIVEETRFSSAPGWDDADDWSRMAGEGPAARQAAHDVWGKLHVDGANYQAILDGLGSDPRVTRPLALAALADANVACQKTDEWEDCGGTWADFENPDPTAGFDDPCLRRNLAIWALERGQLTDIDAQRLTPQLMELMALPSPETTLQSLAMQVANRLPPGTRHAMLQRFADARRGGDQLNRDWYRIVEDRWFEGLSDEHLLELSDRGLQPAITHLDPVRYQSAWIAALDDEQTAASVRHVLLEGLADRDDATTNLALTRAAMDSDCGLAMDAANSLADRGLDSWLPSKPIHDDPTAYGHALCMLGYSDWDARGIELWAEFVGPSDGSLPWVASYTSEFEETGASGSAELTRANVADFELPFVGTSFDCASKDDETFVCEGDGASLEFRRGPDGSFYVVSIEQFWAGCEC